MPACRGPVGRREAGQPRCGPAAHSSMEWKVQIGNIQGTPLAADAARLPDARASAPLRPSPASKFLLDMGGSSEQVDGGRRMFFRLRPQRPGRPHGTAFPSTRAAQRQDRVMRIWPQPPPANAGRGMRETPQAKGSHSCPQSPHSCRNEPRVGRCPRQASPRQLLR